MPGYIAPTIYRCKTHDYVYYASNWQDEETNTYYKKGYYDENGNYYENIAFKNQEKKSVILKCDYCDTEVKVDWMQGALPTCPNCAATLHQAENIMLDELESAGVSSGDYNSSPAGPGAGFGLKLNQSINYKGTLGLVIAVFVTAFMMVIGTVIAVISDANDSNDYNYSNSSQYDYDDDDYNYNYADEIYVDAIGRYCAWYDEYESYYDPITDCYFWYDTYLDPYQWQYWYEGISSDYGDYGWMEYDFADDCWYIEVDNGVWEKLPDYYDTSNLWYIED